MARDQHSLDRSERLIMSRDRQTSLRWPMAIDQRLDALVDRAMDAGERTNRRELLAALVLDIEASGDELGEVLRTYRRATVGETVLDAAGEGSVVQLEHHRPGPRVRRQ